MSELILTVAGLLSLRRPRPPSPSALMSLKLGVHTWRATVWPALSAHAVFSQSDVLFFFARVSNLYAKSGYIGNDMDNLIPKKRKLT